MSTRNLAIAALVLSSTTFALASCKDNPPPPPPAEKPEPKQEPKPEVKPEPPPAAVPEGAAGAAAGAANAGAPGDAAKADAVAGGSGVRGVVRFEGKVPDARPIDMSKDPKCVKMNPKAAIQDVKVKDGNLENVFVYVKSGLPADAKHPVRPEKVVLDQTSCFYAPQVLGVQTGQTLEIVNSDPVLHNVHAFAKGAEFNLAMPKQGQRLEKKFKKPQVMIQMKCEVHPWMEAWVGAVDHPYFATTNAAGAFELPGLPAGTYELELWHATLGTQTAQVTVSDGAAAQVSVTFKAKS